MRAVSSVLRRAGQTLDSLGRAFELNPYTEQRECLIND